MEPPVFSVCFFDNHCFICFLRQTNPTRLGPRTLTSFTSLGALENQSIGGMCLQKKNIRNGDDLAVPHDLPITVGCWFNPLSSFIRNYQVSPSNTKLSHDFPDFPMKSPFFPGFYRDFPGFSTESPGFSDRFAPSPRDFWPPQC